MQGYKMGARSFPPEQLQVLLMPRWLAMAVMKSRLAGETATEKPEAKCNEYRYRHASAAGRQEKLWLQPPRFTTPGTFLSSQ